MVDHDWDKGPSRRVPCRWRARLDGSRLLIGFGVLNAVSVGLACLLAGSALPLLPALPLSLAALGYGVVALQHHRRGLEANAETLPLHPRERVRGAMGGEWRGHDPLPPMTSRMAAANGPVMAMPSTPIVPLYRQHAATRQRQLYDPLTDLPGRDGLAALLRRVLAESTDSGEHVALIAFDIDRMKDINGLHGYAMGDQLLRVAARRLEGIARDSVFRLDGDRFVVVRRGLAGIAAAELAAVAALDRLARPIRLGKTIKQEMTPSASVGIALFPDHGADFEALLRCAEMAVDDAKRAGGRRCRLFDRSMIVAMQFRKDIERDLRDALDAGALGLHYQPQIDLLTGRIVGVEALMRWHHPERGPIPPTSFIPIAEASGLIKPMGTWLVHEACRAARRWLDMGFDIAMAINISAAQLRHQNLTEIVAAALDEHGIGADRLELELTESLFVDPSELMMRRSLDRLAEMGIRLAIDDFGTGYSSLAYLKRLPVQKIKIDKSFTQGIGCEETDEALVKVIIHLARTFGKRVLAEGVETVDQQAFLLREGCDSAQGYLFAKPMPYAACTRHLESSAIAGCRAVVPAHARSA